jgi:hypothetical protein
MLRVIHYYNSILTKYWFVPEKYWNECVGNKIIDVVVNLFGYYVASQLINKTPDNKRLFFIGVILWGSSLMISRH